MSPAVEDHSEDHAAERSAEGPDLSRSAADRAASRPVEDHARARVVTDAPLSNPVPVAMRYDPADSSGAVRFAFPGGNEWAFPRDLLESGLRAPASRGDVSVWPCGRAQTVLEFHSPEGVAVVQFDSSPLVRFLRHTYATDARAAPAAASPAGPRG
ncbi:SsgA family sporulation/cell division regulator [Streptomyces sp. ASQP_92]|uniref:SsgA family sporulation/cell division regulator n=1 Tax=Streptomyces sp. ASQP_92 TaxID=2979116 RepID=UPI0028F74898|nr:SsgA family sporulation/cell division regulator [Streptomyces sp. ASQP_92]